MSRRPALAATVLLIVGIAIHSTIPCRPAVWLTTATLLVIGAAVRIGSPATSVPLAVAVMLAGVAAGQLSHFYFPRDDLSAFVGDEPRLAWVEGELIEAPRLGGSVERGRPVPERQSFTLRVTGVRTWNRWVRAGGEVPVTASPPVPHLAAGQTVRIVGRLERPRRAMNPGEIDSAWRQRLGRVLVTLFVSRSYDVEIVRSGPAVSSAALAGVRERVRRLLDDGFGPDREADRAVLRAVVFGDREPALRDVEDAFNSTGTAHVLASNGARVALLAGFVFLLGRLFRVRPAGNVLLTILAVSAFGLLLMPLAQAVRPVLVCAAIGSGTLLRRPVDAVQMLALAAALVLAVHPLDLYSAGFQLGFAIVLGLMLLAGPLARFFLGVTADPDREALRDLVARNALHRWLEAARVWTVRVLAAGLAAWAVAVPLVAFHFQQFNPFTVPFSIVLTLPAMATLVGGFLKVALTAVCPAWAFAWAAMAALPAGVLRHLIGWLARVPAADVPVAPPPGWQIALYYAVLCAPLALGKIGFASRRWVRCAPVGACGGFVAIALCAGFSRPGVAPGGLRVTLLSVGAGQCAVLETTGGRPVLIDAGSSTLSDPLRTCIAPFLHARRQTGIDMVWLSHGDYDHISAVRPMLPRYSPGRLLVSPHFRRHAHESRPCEQLLAEVDREGNPPRLVLAGDHVPLGDSAAIDVLWPTADCTFNSNNAGIVLRVTCGGRSILFPADIQEPAERELLKRPELLRSDVLVAPHHGSGESTTPAFVRAVDPQIILCSSDARLTRKQRTFDAEEAGHPIYRTSRCGALTVEIRPDGTLTLNCFATGETVTIPPRIAR